MSEHGQWPEVGDWIVIKACGTSGMVVGIKPHPRIPAATAVTIQPRPDADCDTYRLMPGEFLIENGGDL